LSSQTENQAEIKGKERREEKRREEKRTNNYY